MISPIATAHLVAAMEGVHAALLRLGSTNDEAEKWMHDQIEAVARSNRAAMEREELEEMERTGDYSREGIQWPVFRFEINREVTGRT